MVGRPPTPMLIHLTLEQRLITSGKWNKESGLSSILDSCLCLHSKSLGNCLKNLGLLKQRKTGLFWKKVWFIWSRDFNVFNVSCQEKIGLFYTFTCSSAGKESTCNAGDSSSIPREGIGYPLQYSWVSLVAQTVKNLLAMWETWVRCLGQEDPLEKGKATHSCILTWRIPWNL